MSNHAMLSASGAHRWLVCTPSAREEIKEPESESVYADEGTLAHELCLWLVRERAFGIDASVQINLIKENELYNEEMYTYCDEFAIYIVDKVRSCPPGTQLMQEQWLSLADYIPEGFGTTDICISYPGTLEIVDFKYGKGVPVDAYENEQMMVYGLGALEIYDILYDIDNVILTIYQPRINNISSYEITSDNLRRWAREVLRPKALMAFQGLGDFIPGEHCRFCRIRASCKAHAQYNLALAAREFDPPSLTDEQITKILLRADGIKKWLSAVQDYALNKAIQGRKWPSMKLVEGKSIRRYTDQQKIIEGLQSEGIEGDKIVNKKIIGITEMSKKIPKLLFEKHVTPYLEKPTGKPTLVHESDGRPDWDNNKAALEDFEPLED